VLLICPNCKTIFADPGGLPEGYCCSMCGYTPLQRTPAPINNDVALGLIAGAAVGVANHAGRCSSIKSVLLVLCDALSEAPQTPRLSVVWDALCCWCNGCLHSDCGSKMPMSGYKYCRLHGSVWSCADLFLYRASVYSFSGYFSQSKQSEGQGRIAILVNGRATMKQERS
jgi:hypothetical protein